MNILSYNIHSTLVVIIININCITIIIIIIIIICQARPRVLRPAAAGEPGDGAVPTSAAAWQ